MTTRTDIPPCIAVYALEINGKSTLRGDGRGSGSECLIRPSAVDLMTYDEDADHVVLTLRNGTTVTVDGRNRDAYVELSDWTFGESD